MVLGLIIIIAIHNFIIIIAIHNFALSPLIRNKDKADKVTQACLRKTLNPKP